MGISMQGIETVPMSCSQTVQRISAVPFFPAMLSGWILTTGLPGMWAAQSTEAPQYLKGDVNRVKGLLAGLSAEDMASTVREIEAGGEVHVAGYDAAMPADLFALTSHARDNVLIVKDGDLIVIDVEVEEEVMA